MDEIKVEKIRMEDGRYAERHVKEVDNGKGFTERVVELHVEEERPLFLSQRVVEKTRPVVYERQVEKINARTGEVLERQTEAVESPVRMQTVETLGTAEGMVSAQSSRPVTQDDLSNAMIDLATVLAQRVTPVPQPVLSMQSVVAEEIASEEKKFTKTGYVAIGIILVEVVALAGLLIL